MRAYWIKFDGHKSGCVEAPSPNVAKTIGAEITGHRAIDATVLPYPAMPRINTHIDPKYGTAPAFCFKPEQCKGYTACPQSYSCSE